MSPLDIIALPGQPGMFARRVAVQAWQSAGSPHVDSAGRLYAEQKHLYDGWREHLPGFNPADNPDDESQRLAHVRFVAFDIDPTADRIKRLTAAGFIRPYAYEPWHWELPNVRSYALVRSIPTTASLDVTKTEQEEDDMSRIIHHPNGSMALAGSDGTFVPLATMDEVAALIGTGAVPKDYVNIPDGLMWNLRTAIAARKAAQSSSNPAAVAAALAPLIVPAVVAAVTADTGITQEQIQAASEAAVRAVFADAATK